MPVVKGGVWTNIEDEILKASVSKYGLNQWARVSSLLARKTPKQCKARWTEWLDPGIRKIEWSKEEDEKLLHLAKLMPTQWRTISPIVGRTATQCLERYQKLLDEAEARENDELGLGGPTGGESQAPSADDVRKLRPGELDPDPESKPAKPDTIDMDEDEKEMLSEARARLANTQGKKAKRKARERQLEDSRRMALLQKRRELKNAGINIKITNRKPGQMDYNADIPFEKKAAPGFYDTLEEMDRNEKQREAFDPRKHQLQNKRKSDQQQQDPESKRRKGDQETPSASYAAAAKAGQMQRIREAEQSSKRRPLNLPAPQVGESELEDIVKMGMAGEQASKLANAGDNEAAKGFVGTYNSMTGSTPIRTPRAPPQEDRVANEIRNIRALTETQSSLLGGENTPLYEGPASTGFDSVTPRKQVLSTPNPLATPRGPGAQSSMNANGAPSQTPIRTPRDNLALNQMSSQSIQHTPQQIKRGEMGRKSQLRSQFAALPKPKEMDFELELPEEKAEIDAHVELSAEDAAERDRRNKAAEEAKERAQFRRRTQVMQRDLPRPKSIDIDLLLRIASDMTDPVESLIAREKALLVAHDALKFPQDGISLKGKPKALERLDDESMASARFEIVKESAKMSRPSEEELQASYENLHPLDAILPGLSNYDEDGEEEHAYIAQAFERAQSGILKDAEQSNALESKLNLHLGGYQKRAKMLRQKVSEANEALGDEVRELNSFKNLQVAEDAAISRRLEALHEEIEGVKKREREAQERYRQAVHSQQNGSAPHVNGNV